MITESGPINCLCLFNLSTNVKAAVLASRFANNDILLMVVYTRDRGRGVHYGDGGAGELVLTLQNICSCIISHKFPPL